MFGILFFIDRIDKNKIKREVGNGKVYCSLYKANPISPNPLIKEELEKLIKELLNWTLILNF